MWFEVVVREEESICLWVIVLASSISGSPPPQLWGAKPCSSAALGAQEGWGLLLAWTKGNRRCGRQQWFTLWCLRAGLEPSTAQVPAPVPGLHLQGPFPLLLPEKSSGKFGVIFLLFSYLLPAGADLSLQRSELHPRGICFALVVHKIAINY